MNYYMADPHFFHESIISLSRRPFNNVEEMNNSIISNINKKVKKNDTLIILGDVCYLKRRKDVDVIIELLNRIHAKKQLIVGNHDKKALNLKEFRKCFDKISMYDSLHDCGRKVILFHYPIEEWDGYFRDSIHLHGHVHKNEDNLKSIRNRFNVGVDVRGFQPISLRELLAEQDGLSE